MKSLIPDTQPSAAAQAYRTTEVARILGVTPNRVRAIVRAGLCQPARRGRSLEFSFQDLVLLRAGHGLLKAHVPQRRVKRALTELARQLPADRPLSGVRIYADGRQVVVRDGHAAWQPDSGQVVFTFAVNELAQQAGALVRVRTRRQPAAPRTSTSAHQAAAWFEQGETLEQQNDPTGACTAYRRALDLDPEMGDAYINLGRLVHEQGNPTEAVRLYHLALGCAPEDPIAHYNLALALEDIRHNVAAVSHYQHALRVDPEFADAHFNIGRLLDHLGRRSEAMQHLRAYKKITEGK